MLTGNAHSFGQKSKLAISLSWIGGYTNAVTFLTCGWYVSHMTGTTTRFGEALVDAAAGRARFLGVGPQAAAYLGFVLAAFWLGAVSSGMMTGWAERHARRSRYVLPMAIEAILLGAFAILVNRRAPGELRATWASCAASGMAACAMGLQNATITRISGAVVRTTHLTGVITDLGLESVQVFFWYRDGTRGRALAWRRHARLWRVARRHPALLRVLLLGSIVGSFLFGVVAATALCRYRPPIAMLPPIVFLMWIILMDWARPIAEVRALDLVGDPEMTALGIDRALLPASVGIYRMTGAENKGDARAPNFGFWAERLEARFRVVILAMPPAVRLDANALLDLEAAWRRCLGEGRRMVLCGVGTTQYKALQAAGLLHELGPENVCPDLEFAIARGIDLARGLDAIPHTNPR